MGSSGAADYEIEKSLRFNTHDSARLDRAISSAGDLHRWTFSCWFKRAGLDTDDGIWFQGDAGSNRAGLQLSSHRVAFIDTGPYGSGATTLDRTSARVLRDPTRWYHVLIQLDSTNATAQDRCKLYLDGELQVGDLLAVNTTFAQSTNGLINSTVSGMRFGANPYNATLSKANVYLAEVHFINGSNVSIDTFGETNAKGNWVPKEVTGVTYGTNGFYLDFSDNSGTTATTLGKDSSGNGNNFTPSNFSVTAGVENDSLTDTPTNNFSTLNPIQGHGTNFATISNGNLDASLGSTTHHAHSSIAMPPSGKWYAECTFTDVETGRAGIQLTTDVSDWGGIDYLSTGQIRVDDSIEQSSLATISDNDIVGIAVDRDANTIQFYKNGSTVGSTESISATGDYQFIQRRNGSSGSNPIGKWNFGQRAFGNLPSGFQALTIQNLPDPTIADPTDHFNTVLYTGNNGTQSITGVGFQPDLVWIKDRESASPGHILTDAVRGAGKAMFTNNTAQEDTNAAAGYLSAFGSDGFTVTDGSSSAARVNSSNDFFSLNWNESATAGFDIVSYTGNGSAGNTVSHSLGVAPDLMIIKNRTTAGPHWFCYMRSMGNTTWIPLDTNSTANTSVTDTLNSTSPTSSIFTLGNNNKVNASSTDYIAYLWAAVEGYSKFWFYTGNGNADGPFVYTGFKPAFMIAKNTATTNYWRMWNNKSAPINPVATGQYPNDPAVEDAPVNWTVDWLSNGFKVRNDDGEMNGDGQDIIYWAWAEEPFKYSTTR